MGFWFARVHRLVRHRDAVRPAVGGPISRDPRPGSSPGCRKPRPTLGAGGGGCVGSRAGGDTAHWALRPLPSTTLQTFARHFLCRRRSPIPHPGGGGNQGQGSWRVFLQTPGMRFLGEISYGIFLWHLFVMETLYWALGLKEFTGQFWLILPPVVIGTIVMGWLSWVVVERPSIAWSHRVTRNPSRQHRSHRQGLDDSHPRRLGRASRPAARSTAAPSRVWRR